MPPKFALKPFIPYESDIQKSMLVQLAYNPLVAWAERVNSGAAMLPSGKGKALRPVKFNTIKGCSDILGQMKVGTFLAVEAKRPPWSKPTDKHEDDQLEFLIRVTRANGIAFFATSIEQVASGIERRVGTCAKFHPLSEVNPAFLSPL